ncbi:MAG: hypothetical protein AAFQ21_02295, partial [Pseudomonadota bacterium]
ARIDPLAVVVAALRLALDAGVSRAPVMPLAPEVTACVRGDHGELRADPFREGYPTLIAMPP